MLAGEYAVLEGGECLSVALQERLTVSAKKNTVGFYRVSSCLWSEPRFFDNISIMKNKTSPVVSILKILTDKFPHLFFDINIKSDLDTKAGLGSSSAVRLAILLACYCAKNNKQENSINTELISYLAKLAWLSQKYTQKQASGYDVITQLYGGLLLQKLNLDEKLWPGKIQKINFPANKDKNTFSFVRVYKGGKGAPTTKVLSSTYTWLKEKKLFSQLLNLSNLLVKNIAEIFRTGVVPNDFFSLVASHRRIFEGSPFYPSTVFQHLDKIKGVDSSWSYKTTGAGGEDSILVFANNEKDFQVVHKVLNSLSWHQMPLNISQKGFIINYSSGEVLDSEILCS